MSLVAFMIIIGIDPGTVAVGCAVVEAANPPRLFHAELLSITAEDPVERLYELHRGLSALILKWRPEAAAVEKLFFAANAKTAMAVSEARGVILLTARMHGITLYQYAPREIKKMLTGDGSADKKQMRKMVLLTVPEAADLKTQDDVFDAIAAGLACCYKEKLHIKRSIG